MQSGRDSAPSFLIISLRYIGDVLLSTPLALSIKESLPEATIDYLVFAGTEGILQKNPYVRTVHTISPGSKNISLLVSLWKKYDYAISANPSDRNTLFSAATGRFSIGFSYFRGNEWWKRILLKECRFYDDRLHIVPLILSQLESLRIKAHPSVVMGFDDKDRDFAAKRLGVAKYVVLHPYARKEYKHWPSEAWGRLAGLIHEKTGFETIFTRTPHGCDNALLQEILCKAPPSTGAFPEPFTLSQLAAAIKGSAGFVGVDTVATHMAASLDIPTVAIFGPTMVRHWGPWPNNSPEKAPYLEGGGTQRFGKVTVLQKGWECVPCNRETCAVGHNRQIKCMAEVAAEEVAAELLRSLSCHSGGSY